MHVAPTNAVNVAFLSVIEGLLAGNVGFVKTGGDDSDYPLLCLKALVECEPDLAPFVYAARISSRLQDLLKALMAQADGVAVWGGEEAVAAVRALAPAHARVIEWGPKISFAYFAAESLVASDVVFDRLARECCLMEQQACSSPQVVYAETADPAELARFAQKLASAMGRVSPVMPLVAPGPAELAERTKVVEIARLESCLPDSATRVLEAADGSWHVIAEGKAGLRASPLFRTVWVKPLPRARIVATLRPMRHYLQTAGLACALGGLDELSGSSSRPAPSA